MAEDITTQLRGAAAMTPGQRLWACKAAADEIDRLREQVGALSARARRQSEQIRQAHATYPHDIEPLRSVVRRLCVRALDDSPLGPVVDTTEARWFTPTLAEMEAVRRALDADQ